MNEIFLEHPYGKGWRSVPGILNQISISDGKILGVNKGQIWFRTGINSKHPYGTAWKQMSGALKYISVGDGKIMGVNQGDAIYYRTGVTEGE